MLRNVVKVSGVLLVVALLAPAVLAQTTDQLTNPAAGDWPTYGRNLQMWRYSPLDQINTSNVGSLRMAWSRGLSTVYEDQGSPVEYGGILYVNGPDRVDALDATTGHLVWEHKVTLSKTAGSFIKNRQRGSVVVYQGKVFWTTGDGRVVALDAKTGDQVWSTQVGAVQYGEGFTAGPIFADGKIIVGPSGADAGGVNGRIIAMDVNSGEILWTFHTVPQPGEPGFDTWQPPSAAQNGGASAWTPGAYDPSTKTVIYGVGQPIPWGRLDNNGNIVRKGDNLYTDSWVALDVDTGKLKWYHQIVPNGEWDGDEIPTPLITNVTINGEQRNVAILAATQGFLIVVDAGTGEWINAYKMVPETTYLKGFQADGTPIIDDSFRFTKPGQKVLNCMMRWVDFEPAAYSPDTGLYYRPNNLNCNYLTDNPRPADWKPGQNPINYGFENLPDRFDHIGAMSAIDPATGKVVWSFTSPYSQYSGAVVTKGNLVFFGNPDRHFRALDAKTGDVLFDQVLPAYVAGNPITYEVNGKQYVAIIDGGLGGVVIDHQSKVPAPVTGDVQVFVFALPSSSGM